MSKPILLTIDDEPQVLNAIERDLRRHYQGDYRVLKSGSGAEALDVVKQLKERQDLIALFLVDQRMPGMSGTDFLVEAAQVYPQARKVLLTAYADTDAAIASINQIGLDYYLMKPWSPPERNLYPILDDLLSDWHAHVTMPYDGIRVVGAPWSPSSHRIKDFLARNQVPYQWLDVERDAEAKTLIEQVPEEERKLPLVYLPGGERLIDPENRLLAEKAGLNTQASQPFYDLLIIGGGPAGLGAAVYGASEGLRTLMVEKEGIGGQAGTSARIENYLGFPSGLSGADLARRAATQARRFGAEILSAQSIIGVKQEDPYRQVCLEDGSEIGCHVLLIATGVKTRQLTMPGVEPLIGKGVFYGAAVTEASACRGQPVVVVGGGNSAGQGAVFLARFASKVTLLVRGSALEAGMSQYLVDQITAIPNIEVRARSEVVEAEGQEHLEAVRVEHKDRGEVERLPAMAMFVFIGAVPRAELVADLVVCDRAGFIMTGPDLMHNGERPDGWHLKRDPFLLETSIPGILAAGDVRHGSVKRVASAIGEGAISVQIAHQYLRTV